MSSLSWNNIAYEGSFSNRLIHVFIISEVYMAASNEMYDDIHMGNSFFI